MEYSVDYDCQFNVYFSMLNYIKIIIIISSSIFNIKYCITQCNILNDMG